MNIIRTLTSAAVIAWLTLCCNPSFASPPSVTEITVNAERGDTVAQYQLGELYKGGAQGVPQDYNEATKWYRKSAEQGYAPAETALGTRLLNKNNEEAYKWFQKAANQGDDAAKMALALRNSSLLSYIRSLPRGVRDSIFVGAIIAFLGLLVFVVVLLMRLIKKHTPEQRWKKFW